MIVIHIPHHYQLDRVGFLRAIDRFIMMTHIQNTYPFREIDHIEFDCAAKYGVVVVPTKFVGHAKINLRVNIVPAKVV